MIECKVYSIVRPNPENNSISIGIEPIMGKMKYGKEFKSIRTPRLEVETAMKPW